jgi:hypothetical protein
MSKSSKSKKSAVKEIAVAAIPLDTTSIPLVEAAASVGVTTTLGGGKGNIDIMRQLADKMKASAPNAPSFTSKMEALAETMRTGKPNTLGVDANDPYGMGLRSDSTIITDLMPDRFEDGTNIRPNTRLITVPFVNIFNDDYVTMKGKDFHGNLRYFNRIAYAGCVFTKATNTVQVPLTRSQCANRAPEIAILWDNAKP